MSGTLREITDCEVCGNRRLVPVLDLGLHPMCDDLVRIGEDRSCREYPIEILFCEACRTAHQRYQVPKQELFPATYHYRSRFTADVLSGMKGLVDSCERRFGGLEAKLVLDVGCNDGSLLDFFRAKGARTMGVEPTGAAKEAAQKGHATFNDFLSESLADAVVAAHGRPDVITFTNVFAHIEDLPAVLRSLRRLLAPHSVIVIENHYLGAVLDGNQFDTFYHEHPRTYSYTSFVYIARALGIPLKDAEFPSRYGGNIRVFLGGVQGGTPRKDIEQRESAFIRRFDELRTNVERWKSARKAQVAALVRKHGKLRAKAFPGRAAILIKLLGLDAGSISAVYEKPGSMKIGHYLPGTRIPIRSDDELFAQPDKTQPILNLAWHIPGEIRGYLDQHDYTGPVVDIVDSADFPRDEG